LRAAAADPKEAAKLRGQLDDDNKAKLDRYLAASPAEREQHHAGAEDRLDIPRGIPLLHADAAPLSGHVYLGSAGTDDFFQRLPTGDSLDYGIYRRDADGEVLKVMSGARWERAGPRGEAIAQQVLGNARRQHGRDALAAKAAVALAERERAAAEERTRQQKEERERVEAEQRRRDEEAQRVAQQAAKEAQRRQEAAAAETAKRAEAARIQRETEVGDSRWSAHIASWNFYDDEGRHFPQSVHIQQGEVKDADGEKTTLYRWHSEQDDSGGGEYGPWTTDGEAKKGGLLYAAEQNQGKTVKAEEAEEAEPAEDAYPKRLNGKGKTAAVIEIPDEEAAACAARLFGGEDEEAAETAAAVSGVPDDGSAELSDNGRELQITVKHKHIDECIRTVGQDENGDTFIHNDYFRARKDAPDGFGTAFLARQAEKAKEAGVAYLETHAAGSWRIRKDFNGYYTWAKLGYDEALDDLEQEGGNESAVVSKAREHFPDANSILDIMDSTPVDLNEDAAREIRQRCATVDEELGRPTRDRSIISGSDWWLAYGIGFEQGKFDLSDGSRSLRTLARYVRK
jgi:hypothetical protein